MSNHDESTLADSATLRETARHAECCVKAAKKAVEDLDVLLSRRTPDLDYLITVDDATETFSVVLAGNWIIDRFETRDEAMEEAQVVRGDIARVAAERVS